MMPPGTAVPPDPRAYVRIAGMLREMISSHVLPPGSPAPSISSLCREYGHARQTCGRAMRLLEDEGLLHRVPGARLLRRGVRSAAQFGTSLCSRDWPVGRAGLACSSPVMSSKLALYVPDVTV